ncbi:MAG: acyl-CoA/acyl-ACP dehydrogenase [Acidimicrobiia bacterium]|nr:acyl-CoA/acyl-ACP dehydrogenase [Acidimicrobiia bacterium]
MNFAFTDEQEMLRSTVAGFLDSRVPMARVRELMETDSGIDPAVWSEMAGMGIAGMHIPEEFGGAGFTHLELGVVLEETGRRLTPSPLLATAVLGANLVLLAGSDEQRKTLLPGVASGEHTLAVAIVDQGGGWDPATITATARSDGDTVVLDGVKSYVVDGHTADTVIVAALEEAGELGFYLVDGDAPGLTRERLETLDMTRKQATVRIDGVSVGADARLERGGAEVVAELYDLAAVGLAFESVGGASRGLDMSVSYAKQRMQFGRPIGSFQAVKHTCADMLVAVESARSAAYYAGWAASAGDPELRIAAPLAKAFCTDAYYSVAADTIQVHGGIGFTWEHDAHLYFKRAKTSQLMLGNSAAWRAELADRIGL